MTPHRLPVLLLLPLALFTHACQTAAPQDARTATDRAAAPAPARDRHIEDGYAAARERARARIQAAPARSRVTIRAPEPRPQQRETTVRGLSFVDEPLFDAIRRLQVVTSAPILVTPQARQIIDEQAVTVDLELTAPLPLRTVLDLLVARSPDLGWKIEDDVIFVTSKDDARGPMVVRTFDVRDLMMPRPNFPAPRIIGLPTGDEIYPEEPESTRMVEPDQLIDLIRNATDPTYWDETDGASLEITDSGMLIVRAHAEMLGAIGDSTDRARGRQLD